MVNRAAAVRCDATVRSGTTPARRGARRAPGRSGESRSAARNPPRQRLPRRRRPSAMPRRRRARDSRLRTGPDRRGRAATRFTDRTPPSGSWKATIEPRFGQRTVVGSTSSQSPLASAGSMLACSIAIRHGPRRRCQRRSVRRGPAERRGLGMRSVRRLSVRRGGPRRGSSRGRRSPSRRRRSRRSSRAASWSRPHRWTP